MRGNEIEGTEDIAFSQSRDIPCEMMAGKVDYVGADSGKRIDVVLGTSGNFFLIVSVKYEDGERGVGVRERGEGGM